MKNIWTILIVSLAVLLIVGCSDNVESNDQTNVTDVAGVTDNIKIVPDRRAEISGSVKSIIGNELVVSLIVKNNSNLSETGTELTDEEKAAKRAENQGNGGGKSNGGMSEIELSGETIDVIIPVGISVIQSNGTGEMIELNIGDIFKGTVIKIWTIEGGDGSVLIAEFVQVLNQ